MVLGLGTVMGAADYFPSGTPLASQRSISTAPPQVGDDVVVCHDGLGDIHNPTCGLKKDMTGIVVEVEPIVAGKHAGRVVFWIPDLRKSFELSVNCFWTFCDACNA